MMIGRKGSFRINTIVYRRVGSVVVCFWGVRAFSFVKLVKSGLSIRAIR
jgi:hypothetical protein